MITIHNFRGYFKKWLARLGASYDYLQIVSIYVEKKKRPK